MDDKKDLLIEIGTEDLPARLLKTQLCQNFCENIINGLKNARLEVGGYTNTLCSPRRIAMVIENLSTKQDDELVTKYGPAVTQAFDDNGEATKAALGFAKSCGVEVNELAQGEQDGKTKLKFHQNKLGLNTTELLQEIIAKALKDLPIPKSMRWNHTDAEFVRPIRWLLVMFGTEVVSIELFGVEAKNISYGHRFHSPGEIIVEKPSAYKELLEVKGKVLVDFDQRQQTIVGQVNAIAKQAKGQPSYTQALLDEITNLVEWPNALLGSFDKKFLEVHKELLISTMQDNQKYIPLLDEYGELLSKFIIVSNIESKNPASVTHGNEKVIVPRFEDAMFFWQRDKNIKLEENIAQLDNVVYEKKLGSIKNKTDRVAKLAVYLSSYTHADEKLCERAAKLSKCDLVSETVGEFPKLQGIVGRNLAALDKEDDQVCVALEEQYLPKQAGGVLPKTAVGMTLAIADRIDTLVGIFAAGKKPTGLKDPYGLRRAALAVLRIIIETPLNVNLNDLLEKSASLFEKNINATSMIDDVSDYINDRYRAYFSDRDIPVDVTDAVLANHVVHPSEVAAKVNALMDFRNLENAASLAAANKRIRNILKKIDADDIGKVDSGLFKENAEKTLFTALEAISDEVENFYANNEYEKALHKLAGLRQPVDTFFDDVMVMDKDEKLKANRLALLSRIDSLFMQVADFSRLQS